MRLATGVAAEIKRGYYFVQAQIGTGSAAATISIDGLTAIGHDDFTFAAAGYVIIPLPECTITPTLTGDAVLAISPVAIDAR
jgi:hypothetical protein